MIKNNKILLENPAFIVLYQKLLATRIYIDKNIAKAQPRLRDQVERNRPGYYTSVSMNASRKIQQLI